MQGGSGYCCEVAAVRAERQSDAIEFEEYEDFIMQQKGTRKDCQDYYLECCAFFVTLNMHAQTPP